MMVVEPSDEEDEEDEEEGSISETGKKALSIDLIGREKSTQVAHLLSLQPIFDFSNTPLRDTRGHSTKKEGVQDGVEA